MSPFPPTAMANAFRAAETNSSSGIAWFEFLLEPSRLEEHLKGTNGRQPGQLTIWSEFIRKHFVNHFHVS
jgi:hypothetical protein